MGINHTVNEELLKTDHQYKRLHDKHSSIKEKIHEIRSSLSIDTTKLNFLKRKKLLLADEMFMLDHK